MGRKQSTGPRLDHQIVVALTKDDMETLRAVAESDVRTVASYVRRLVLADLDAHRAEVAGARPVG